jgi:hypothetical protein
VIRRGARIALLLSLGTMTGEVSAAASAPPAPPASAGTAIAAPPITIAAMPIFGADAAQGDGWIEVVARIENVSTHAVKGSVELTSTVAAHRGEDNLFTAKAPFNVPAGKSVVVKLPTHALANYVPTVTLRARGENGEKLVETTLSMNNSQSPLLVDVEPAPKIFAPLRSWAMPILWNPHAGSYYYYSTTAKPPLTVGAPGYDRTSGDPVLPDRAASYAPVTALLVRSDVVAKLEGPALEALVNWVLSGGSLAVVVARPEDLRSGPVSALVGGVATRTSPPPLLYSYPAAEKPADSGHSFDAPDPWETPEVEDAGPPPTPINFFIPIKATPGTAAPPRAGPLGAVREQLSGFAGANLRPSAYGATATYGLGEVHLLAFDPQTSPGVDDAWVHGRMIDLLRHAYDRRAAEVFPLGSGERRANSLQEIRRSLDPNENFRIALGIAAILLVAYSIVAGPLTFIRASKRGRPLDPLVWAPLWAATAFGCIVLLGLAGKGWRGRARHVALVEVGAGMERGVVRRFRGFFSSHTQSLTIEATDRTCVLDVVASDSREHGDAVMRLDRNGARLENLTALPWQTVVVAEDGMHDFKGGVSVLPTSDGSVDVVNHTGRALEHLLVYVPRVGIHWFDSLADGAEVHAASGKLLLSAAARTRFTAGTKTVFGFDPALLATHIPGKSGEAMQHVWTPITAAGGNTIDWFPEDAAVVLAEIVGGEGVKSDSGLSVESDRLLLRVVGEGGAR